MRLVLATLSTQKYALIITLPALCSDAWTLQNIFKEISSLYDTYQNDLEETSVLNNSEQSIGNLEILSDVERQRLLVE